MIPQIIIRSETGGKIGTTFPKRARQLVNKQKARWLDESHNEIYLTATETMEEDIVEHFKSEMDNDCMVSNGQKSTTETAIFENKVILDLAKRRLVAKRNIIGQVIDFILILCCSFMFVSVDHEWDRVLIALALCAFWGIRLLIRIVKFAKPSFKNGVVAYFRGRREREIESEYNRLRKMSAEYVMSELNK